MRLPWGREVVEEGSLHDIEVGKIGRGGSKGNHRKCREEERIGNEVGKDGKKREEGKHRCGEEGMKGRIGRERIRKKHGQCRMEERSGSEEGKDRERGGRKGQT